MRLLHRATNPIDFTSFGSENTCMVQSHPSRRNCSVSFLAVVGRCLLCLCLWNSPLPLLHAHPGAARDQATELAEHLHECHWRHGAEDCSCWHLHLVLWGEVQADHPESDSVPPQPRPVDDSAVPGMESTQRHLADAERLVTDQCGCLSLVSDVVGHSQLQSRPIDRSSLKSSHTPITRMTVIRC